MKKIIYLLALFTLFTSCDDGDIVLENLNFENKAIDKCTTSNTVATGLLFKMNGSELLLINIPAQIFNSELSSLANPKVYTITDNQIIYRKYSNTVNKGVICDAVPPASPNVTGQWTGQPGGTIEVITSEVFTTNETTNVTSLTGYSHVILFKNIQLKNEQNSFVYENYYFGEYIVNISSN